MDVPDDRKFIGFDGYQKAMDCLKPGDVAIFATPPAFRWVHFTYAIEKGLNVFMEKPITVDGPTSKQDVRAGRRVEEEEPEGRRRPDVPALQGPAGTVRPHQGRRDRRHHHAAGLSHERSGRLSCFTGAQAEGRQRAAVADRAVPQLPVGQRRLLQRLLDPQHRRMLLDERRLADQGAGRSAAGTTAATTSIRTSTPTRSSTRLPTARKLFLDGRNMPGCNDEFASYAHGTKGSADHLHVVAHAGQVPASTRARTLARRKTWSGRSRRTSRTPTSSNGTT